mmetsp:Transcript_1891/g.4176  ORF Transcript_1891/g.4176 Transcript_1891/m.4176 type:complete len:212 (+) Transcript_1891:363-998(+)
MLKAPKVIMGRSKSHRKLPIPKEQTQIKGPGIFSSASTPNFEKRLNKSAALVRKEADKPKTAVHLNDSCRVVELSPDNLFEDTDQYKVTRYSIPRALTSTRKSRSQTGNAANRNRSIEEFLNRFEKPSSPVEPPPRKVGMDGWKLAKIKSNSRRHNSRKAFFTPKMLSPPIEFGELDEGKSPEIYLDYLQFKRMWANERSGRAAEDQYDKQ